jgi:large subunit ribosomal protein L4
MKTMVYNQEGKEIGQTLLPKEVFGLKLNTDLVHQVAISQRANRRQVIAHTKGRGEVRGGGRKPWRQKGTGRARAGSTRSPIWKGGGVTFGPSKERNFMKRIPKKMKRKALFQVLSAKAKDNLLIVLDYAPPAARLKTKTMNELLDKLSCKGQTGLIALPQINQNIILAVRNLPRFQTIQAKDLNILDLLSFKYLIMPKESIKVIKETFLKNEKPKAKSEKQQYEA